MKFLIIFENFESHASWVIHTVDDIEDIHLIYINERLQFYKF